MQTIYVVNAGCYSNYRVVALFSTKEKATAFMAAIPDDYNDIEEFALDSDVADLVTRGYSQWTVLMLRDGTTERVRRHDSISTYGINQRPRVWRRSQINGTARAADCLDASVMATDETHAAKIANEYRMQMIATGQWD